MPEENNDKGLKRIFDEAELRSLGFPDELIEPLKYLHERGAFDVEPDEAALQKTIDQSLKALDRGPSSRP